MYDINNLTRKGQKKILHENVNQKKARASIFISDKIDFQSKSATRDTKGHYIIKKGH